MAIRTVGRNKITITINALTAVQISATNLFVTDFEIHFPAGNTGATAYIGSSTVDNTWIPRGKGISFNFSSGTGSLGAFNNELGFNLSQIYVQGSNAGDTAIIEYMHYEKTS